MENEAPELAHIVKGSTLVSFKVWMLLFSFPSVSELHPSFKSQPVTHHRYQPFIWIASPGYSRTMLKLPHSSIIKPNKFSQQMVVAQPMQSTTSVKGKIAKPESFDGLPKKSWHFLEKFTWTLKMMQPTSMLIMCERSALHCPTWYSRFSSMGQLHNKGTGGWNYL